MQSFEELGVQTFVTDGRTFRNQYVSPEHVRSWYGITTPFLSFLLTYLFSMKFFIIYCLYPLFIVFVSIYP